MMPPSNSAGCRRRLLLCLLLALSLSLLLPTHAFFLLPSSSVPVTTTPCRRSMVTTPSSPTRRYLADPTMVSDAVTTATEVVTTVSGGANNPQQVAEAMLALLKGPSGFGIFGLTALCVRLYTYFTVQSFIARLTTLLVDHGTTVELRYGNSLRNLFYYEPGPGKMEKLIIPTADPKNQQTIAEVCARLKVAAKATYDVVALPESFEQLKLPEESVDTVVSTYMWNKSKNPLVTFTKAMELLKDGGAFVFVEPVCGDNPLLAGVRRYFGQIHRATGAFGDPSLDVKGIVNAWAETIGKNEGIELDLDVEEQGYFLDPHIVGVAYKRRIDRGPDYQPTNAEKRRQAKRRGALAPKKGFGGGGSGGNKEQDKGA